MLAIDTTTVRHDNPMTPHAPEAVSRSTTDAADASTPQARSLVDGPVRRIGILRAQALDGMMCALPALRALCAHWPQAELVLIGLPSTRHWALRQNCIHHFIEFPGWRHAGAESANRLAAAFPAAHAAGALRPPDPVA
ncbi:glycosyltransferase family 9 protein [Variovorax sp. OV329]|uniref:glycosyltransferase family 9 protein n=1 Tax=Variovorax sp. OV329 TaxID=1882825 RepID=UPI001113463D|nr:glycosyltransferase family 9 protein [Variovorax sp. OV329]